jgi:hypothetical protein
MASGPQTRRLTPAQINLLEKFRRASHEGAPHGYTLPMLRSAMGASFGWQTLKKALAGRPVLELHHAYIVQWMERYLEPEAPVRDGKAAASGEKDEEAEATGTIREPMDGK